MLRLRRGGAGSAWRELTASAIHVTLGNVKVEGRRPRYRRACSRLSSTSALALGTLLMALVLTSAAGAANVATLTASLSPDRLGAKGALTIAFDVAGGEFGVPTPVQRTVLRFPAGMGIEIPQLRSCSIEHLQQLGADGCPRQSRLGAGHALVLARPASETLSEDVVLSAFLGPPRRLQPTLDVLGEGLAPIAVRMVVAGTVAPAHAPYGEQVAMSIPPIPTVPLAPDASLADLSLTIGAARSSRTSSHASVVVPGRCPRGGFPFAAEFTYADGSSGRAATTVPCPTRTAR
jgi:hypothetical protein